MGSTSSLALVRHPSTSVRKRDQKEAAKPVSALGLVAPAPVLIQTPSFEGPLETLFLAVRDHKIDLAEIPLAPICEAYWIYVVESPNSSLDECATALVALSYLLERKAWMLLPTAAPEPEQVEEDLALMPPTVHLYEQAIEVLRESADLRDQLFFRSSAAFPDGYELPYTLENVAPNDLAMALTRILSRMPVEKTLPVIRPKRLLSDVIELVLLAVSYSWRPLEELLPEDATRSDVVYWFLALLELIRLGKVFVRFADDQVEFATAA